MKFLDNICINTLKVILLVAFFCKKSAYKSIIAIFSCFCPFERTFKKIFISAKDNSIN